MLFPICRRVDRRPPDERPLRVHRLKVLRLHPGRGAPPVRRRLRRRDRRVIQEEGKGRMDGRTDEAHVCNKRGTKLGTRPIEQNRNWKGENVLWLVGRRTIKNKRE